MRACKSSDASAFDRARVRAAKELEGFDRAAKVFQQLRQSERSRKPMHPGGHRKKVASA